MALTADGIGAAQTDLGLEGDRGRPLWTSGQSAPHGQPGLGLPLRVLPATTAILRPDSWPWPGLPSMRALLWERGHSRGSAPAAAGRALHVPLSAGPSALRCLHFIGIFEPSKRTEKKSLCKLSVMHVPQKQPRTESSRKQRGSRGKRWRSELTELPSMGPAPAAASASEAAGVRGAGGIQEPLGKTLIHKVRRNSLQEKHKIPGLIKVTQS